MTRIEKEDSVTSMIARVELSAEIARIALACPNCNGHVRDATIRFQNRNKSVNPVGGHSSVPTTNESQDGFTSNEINRPRYT